MTEHTLEFKDDADSGSTAKTAAGKLREQYIAEAKPAIPTGARKISPEQQVTGKTSPRAREVEPVKITTTLADGTTRTVQELDGGSVVIKTHPPYYPKDGYQIEQRTGRKISKGIETFSEIHIKDTEDVRGLAISQQEKIEKEHHFRGSRDGDKYPRGKVRNLTLAEGRTLENVLPKFPVDEQKGLNINFFDGQNVISDLTNGYFNPKENAIGINPRASREKMLQGENRYVRGKDKALEVAVAHEMSHDLTFRLDPKGYRDGTLDLKLAKTFGMKLVEEDNPNSTKHKRIWLVEGEELVQGKNQTFYYKPTGSGYRATRCDISGKPVDISGKPVDADKAIIADINKVAKVKLPSSYAYQNPKEAAAEIWVSYGINEASRAALRKTTSAEVYAWIEEADQKIINAAKANKPNPDGWIRIPSGDIVPGNKQNKDLVLAFNQKHLQPKKR